MKSKKKVLIVAYYWPPGGGGGVQRWVKFVKYLPEFGWEPIVFIPENADYPLKDQSLASEVSKDLEIIRFPIREPRKIFKRFSKKKEPGQRKGPSMDQLFYMDKSERSWKQNLAIWLRGNLFIPDARVLWVKPAIRFLSNYLKENVVDAVITTGPPHSLHLIGLGLKKKLNVNWIADFRDPWRQIEYYDKLMLTRRSDHKHMQLEKAVISSANAVVEATYYWTKKDQELGVKRSEVITNGYDTTDFSGEPIALSKEFSIRHLGTLAYDRNPAAMWDALHELCSENPEFKTRLSIELIGHVDARVLERAAELGLKEQVKLIPYMDHDASIELMRSAQILLLLINNVAFNAKGRMTGKIFEYLAAERPIFLIGPPDGDAARVIEETTSGFIADFDEKNKIKEIIKSSFEKYMRNELHSTSVGYDQFSRKNLTKKLAGLLNEITGADER